MYISETSEIQNSFKNEKNKGTCLYLKNASMPARPADLECMEHMSSLMSLLRTYAWSSPCGCHFGSQLSHAGCKIKVVKIYYFLEDFMDFWFIITLRGGWSLNYPLHQNEQLSCGHSTKHLHTHYPIWVLQELGAGIMMSF